MSAGANQQLIASKLEEAHEIGDDKKPSAGTGSGGGSGENSDGTTDLAEGESTKLNKKSAKPKAEPPKKKEDDGALTISHEKEGDVDEVGQETEEEAREAATKAAQEELEKQTQAVPAKQQEQAAEKAEEHLAQQLAGVAPAAGPAAAGATPSVADLQKDLAAANAEVNEAAAQPPVGMAETNQWQTANQAPSMGGTLNATTEQAEQDKRRELEDDRNHTILTHGSGNNYVGGSTPTFQSPLNAASQPQEDQQIVDPFRGEAPSATLNAVTPVSLPPIAPPAEPEPSRPKETLADIDRENRSPHEEARAAVDAAFGAVPFTPAGNPEAAVGALPLGSDISHDTAPSATLPPMPPMPDFSTLPPLPTAPDGTAPAGALPPEKLEDMFGTPPAAPAPAPQSNDPAQFKIPGQG
jgi:hypothetical protein